MADPEEPDNREEDIQLNNIRDRQAVSVEFKISSSTCVIGCLLALIVILLIVILLGLMFVMVSDQRNIRDDNYPTKVFESVEKRMKNQRSWMEKEENGYCQKSVDDILLQGSLVDNITAVVVNNIKQLLDKHNSNITTILNILEKLLRINSPDLYSNIKDVLFSSCADVLEKFPDSPSANYFIKSGNGRLVSAYCDMNLSCGGITGGWRRVGYLNISEEGAKCPTGFTQGVPTSCKLDQLNQGCYPVLYENFGILHTSVCGKINGFHENNLDGFKYRSKPTNTITINSNYVDGVSLTHYKEGKGRDHIWTFAAGNCQYSKTDIPKFVGNHYSFDNGSLTDLLWDDVQCPRTPSSNSAWFSRNLAVGSLDDIEMRVCRDNRRTEEDVLLTNVAIYVH